VTVRAPDPEATVEPTVAAPASATPTIASAQLSSSAVTLPEPPKSGGRVVKRSDGTCWFHYHDDCPKDAHCNPPEPEQVRCSK
jgi:hypothetical protein